MDAATITPRLQAGRDGGVPCSALFGVIYCDPPWRRDNDVPESSVDNHYPTMTTAEICALKIPAKKHCLLLMWAIVPMMPEAFDVLKAWGFKYKSQLVWDKLRTGCGWWVRNQHEVLIIATRGNVRTPPPPLRIPSVFRAKRGKHSSKPDQIRDWIAKWNPTEKKLEMFARPYTEMWPKHEGWETWGNELPNDVEMTPNNRICDT